MRKLYVPIMMDPEHRVEIYHDDFKRLGVDHLFLTECVRFVHEHGDRYAFAIENTKKHVKIYEELGYDCGVWISTLGYGGSLFSNAVENKTYTPIRSITGREAGDAICPTDKNFVARVCKVVTDLAKAGAKMILLDDDLCLSVRPGLGCACKAHIAEFCRRIGKTVTLAELPDLLFTGKPNEERRAWLDMQGDTLRDFCRTLRRALDEVAPNVRMGFCAGYTSWDVEGVDAIELSRILAGNTKPFLRFTSAPYWLHAQRFGQAPLPTLIEFARMQAAWAKNEDIEVFTECDTYPHDRFHTPLSHVQCFDTATMLTKDVGVLKYFYHYPCKPETERGYVNAHLAQAENCAALQKAFYTKEEVGVRVYEPMHRLASATLPEKFDPARSQKQIMSRYAFSEAQKMLSVNAIPTVYEGRGLCGIVFGENASDLTDEALQGGLILDVTAAEMLQKRGIDVGLRSASPLDMTVLEDFGIGTPVSVYFATDLCNVHVAEGARVISEFVDTDYLTNAPRRRVPSAYLYENAQGQRFLVYAFRAQNQPENSGMYWSYRRGAQIAAAIEWLGGKPLPVDCTGEPYGYCRCNENENSVAVAYFNCTSDGIETLDFKFARDVKNVSIIGAKGTKTDARTVRVEDVRGYGYVAIEAEYA
jgi:hypothetical protein